MLSTQTKSKVSRSRSSKCRSRRTSSIRATAYISFPDCAKSVPDILAYEQGELSEKETYALFQRLIDNGSVWKMQGSYGRLASDLIAAGYCMLDPVGHRDYWGNEVPSRFEVAPGTKGSPQFVQEARKRMEAM